MGKSEHVFKQKKKYATIHSNAIKLHIRMDGKKQYGIWKKEEEGEEEKIAQSHSLVINFSLIKEFLHFIQISNQSTYRIESVSLKNLDLWRIVSLVQKLGIVNCTRRV